MREVTKICLTVSFIAITAAATINSFRSSGPASEASSTATWEGVAQAIQPSVVKIHIGTQDARTKLPVVVGWGSGFVISGEGVIATCAHVIAELKDLKRPWVGVEFSNGARYFAKKAVSSETIDMAIITMILNRDDPKEFPFLTFSEEGPLLGQSILSMGTTEMYSWGVTSGIVSSAEITDENLFHGTAVINSGFSGGPTVNLKGQVVGMNKGYLVTTTLDGVVSKIPGASSFIPGPLMEEVLVDLLKGEGEVWLDRNNL